MSRQAPKRGIQVNVAVSLLFALVLIGLSFDQSGRAMRYSFFPLGIAGIVAAIKNIPWFQCLWLSRHGRPFRLFVFGGVSVLGSHYLQTKAFDFTLISPATAIGCLSVAVLNLNNLRDMENDRHSNKITLPILLGFDGGKRYHYFLFITALLTSFGFVFLQPFTISHFLFLLLLLPLGKHLRVSPIGRGQRP